MIRQLTCHLDRARRSLSRFAQDRRGVSAVEFAMMLPLMASLYLGTFEISQGISVNRKVTLTARTVADLVSQASVITNVDMTNILNASAAIVAPFDSTKVKVTVSSVNIDSTGKATILWSDALNTTARPAGQVVTLPAALVVPSTTMIWGEVTYTYDPPTGYVITGTLSIADRMYMRPRLTTSISRVAS